MPAARSTSPCSPWPACYPPSLAYLSDPHPPHSHAGPASLPAPWGTAKPRTMQDDLDDLDRDEDILYTRLQTMDTRQYGYSWLVPLGRQSTHDEDADSAFSTSPHHGLDTTLDLALSPPNHAGGFVPPAAADDAPVVDLDAEIEDADADTTTGSEDDALHGSGTDTASDAGPTQGTPVERGRESIED
ncbi:hypothetical protein JCM3770_003839 [Rhodotorula araucariae]